MSWHPLETELALYASGDLTGTAWLRTMVHVRRCAGCRALAAAYRDDEQVLADLAEALPPGVNWDRLSAEMTANIHLGLAAGECVTPAAAKTNASAGMFADWNWKPAAALAGLFMVFTMAWWLNLPVRDSQVISNAFGRWWNGQAGIPVDHGPVVEAGVNGIEFRENGGGLEVSSGDAAPVAVSVSFDGSASARYIDESTGQVAITTVYVQ